MINANALTDSLTGKINTPASNSTKNITNEARIDQSILTNPGSRDQCSQDTLDKIWSCTKESCACDNPTFINITQCLETLVGNKDINNASGTAIRTQYGVTCAAMGSAIPGFSGASRLSYGTGLIGGIVFTAVLSVIV
ncbi:hypothetical protein D9758_005072 [Tetrapyrgos nigripes]|uniref:Uncharacterized protein n=1 Tax=Tetrapyrgos nigripes TaxID=182062 RepID=A0A8H5GWI9_9AGAR|nr:hypothetical protein D9758_005072 [Tetrapyrgos nigripes]